MGLGALPLATFVLSPLFFLGLIGAISPSLLVAFLLAFLSEQLRERDVIILTYYLRTLSRSHGGRICPVMCLHCYTQLHPFHTQLAGHMSRPMIIFAPVCCILDR